MTNRSLVGLALTSAMILNGCGPSSDSADPKTQESAAQDATLMERAKAVSEQASAVTKASIAQGKEAAQAALDKGRELAEQARPVIDAAQTSAAQGLDQAAEKGAAMAQAAGQVVDAALEKAKELIAEAKTYIDEQKPELARRAVNKLNVLKDVMPLAIQEQIEKLEAALPPESDELGNQADFRVSAQTTPQTGTP